jgi:hypothetical protein
VRTLICTFFLVSLLGATVGSAQTIRLEFSDTSVSEALETYARHTGVDVVHSPDLVRSLRTSCRYRGTSKRDALICIMSGHDFRIEPISSNQAVLIPLTSTVRRNPSDATRVLTGFVQDAETGESLRGAHVILPGIGAGTTTNEAGFFAFPEIGEQPVSLAITYLGYGRLDTTVVSRSVSGTFPLVPVAFEVAGVVVEEDAERRADAIITPGLVSLSGRELQQMPGTLGNTDVLESLKWMPGIQRAGEATGGLLVRGSGPDQNLYLIDGAPVYHPWHAFSLISTFQTDTFKDVSMYRGAFPAEFGGRLSSVLNAQLRDGSRSDASATLGISGLNASFIMESPLSKRSSFMLSGRRSYIDRIIGRSHPVEDDFGRRDTLRTGYHFYDWSAKYSFRPDARSSVSISWYSGRDALDLRLPFDLSLDFSSWLRPADLFFEVDQEWGNRILSTRYQRLLSSRLFLTGTLFYSRYRARENALIQPSQSSRVASAYRVDLEDTGVRMVLDWYPSLSHQVRFGAEAVQHRFDSGIDARIAYTPTLVEPLEEGSQTQAAEVSLFIQDTWSVGPTVRVLPGIRASWFGSGPFLRVAPRLSVQWAAEPTWVILRAAASSHVQYLQRIRDRNAYLYDLVSSRWIPAQADAPPARSRQISLGWESHGIPRTVLHVDGFVREGSGTLLPEDNFQSKSGLLGPGIEVATLLGQYDRGEERSRGIEVGTQTRTDRWLVMTSYTHARSENRIAASPKASFRPARFDTPHAFSVVLSFRKARWNLGSSVDWRSGYPVSVPTARYQLEDPVSGEATWYFHRPTINNGRLPYYMRIDIQGAYRFTFANASWSTGLSLYNVLNRRNVTSQSWDPSVPGGRPENRLGLPILPMIDVVVDLQ